MARTVEACPKCGHLLRVVETVTKKKAEEIKKELAAESEPPPKQQAPPGQCGDYGKPDFSAPECATQCKALVDCAKAQECFSSLGTSERCLMQCPVTTDCLEALKAKV